MRNEAERAEARRQAREQFDKEYGGSEASSSSGEPSSGDFYGIEERCKRAWDRDPGLRAEFGGQLERYIAFAKADARGLVRILGRNRNA